MTKESFIQRLRQKGFKVTPQRISIIEAIENSGDMHPSAFQVHKEARKKSPKLSLSTTYATIKEFSRLHLIKTLQFDRTANRFEVDLEDHINLICKKCGKISDYKSSESDVRGQIKKRTGFQVRDSRLEFYGLCRNCTSDNKR
jgi:Fur family transcriptional regulator, peroxide stress response regulator